MKPIDRAGFPEKRFEQKMQDKHPAFFCSYYTGANRF